MTWVTFFKGKFHYKHNSFRQLIIKSERGPLYIELLSLNWSFLASRMFKKRSAVFYFGIYLIKVLLHLFFISNQ